MQLFEVNLSEPDTQGCCYGYFQFIFTPTLQAVFIFKLPNQLVNQDDEVIVDSYLRIFTVIHNKSEIISSNPKSEVIMGTV